MKRCTCGRRMSKYANECLLCSSKKMAAIHAEAERVVASGKCPDCGATLRRNLSMAGWWQCGRLGAPGFKLPEYEGKGDCSFQCFTE